MVYTLKINNAIKFAIKTHEIYQKQARKGKNVAYITHPLTVGIILAKAGATEDVIVAGILHDTIEDSVLEKKVTPAMLTERFGDNVSQLVWSVTEHDRRLPWDERKSQALAEINKSSGDSLLIKSADILSNMLELLDDHARYGDPVFERFSVPKEKTVKHQLAATQALINCWPENPLLEDLLSLEKSLQII